MEVTIKKNHFTYNGTKYFRKAAESLNLGSYGNKDKNVFVSNGLIHDDTVKGSFPVKAVTEIKLQNAKTSKNSFDVGGTFVTAKVNGKGGAKVGWTKDQLRDLSLIKIDITSESELRKLANNDRNCFNKLKSVKNGRITDQIFVIVESKLIQNASFNASGSADVSILNDKFSINISGSTSNTNTLKLDVSAGSIFAYALRKPKFDTRIKKKANKIENLDRDEWGLS